MVGVPDKHHQLSYRVVRFLCWADIVSIRCGVVVWVCSVVCVCATLIVASMTYSSDCAVMLLCLGLGLGLGLGGVSLRMFMGELPPRRPDFPFSAKLTMVTVVWRSV